jgi:hypothetical protein
MMLEALSSSCWSDRYVLKLDGRPRGEYRGRWFSESVDISLMGRRQLHLEKSGWWGSRFALIDDGDGLVLAGANRSGVFTSAWDLRLSNGPGRLVSAGWSNTSYHVVQSGRVFMEINQVGFCRGGWAARSDGLFEDTDLLFVGLIYHTIVRRHAAGNG